MDKQLLKAYIRTIVEEEVTRVLPKMLSEAVQQIKQLNETKTPVKNTSTNSKFSREQLQQMMGITYDGETLRAEGTPHTAHTPVTNNPEIHKIINRDYSQLMKNMGLT